LKWLGIGVAFTGLTLLSLPIQQFAPFGSIGISAITIGMVKIGEYENSVKLREDRNKKTKERIATLKKALFKLYHDIGKEVEKYSYLTSIATNPVPKDVTTALLDGWSIAGRKLEVILVKSNIERIYERIQNRLKEKIEFSHWAIIEAKFKKAILLKQRATELRLSMKKGNPRDSFDIRVSKFPSLKTELVVDLFDLLLKYILVDRQDRREKYS
jgi:hypothetical protein